MKKLERIRGDNKITTVSFDALDTFLSYYPSKEKVYSDICKCHNVFYSENEFKEALSFVAKKFTKKIKKKIYHPNS